MSPAARAISRLCAVALAAGLATVPARAEMCLTDLEHVDITIDGAHAIAWADDPGAAGYCRVVMHYATVCDAPSASATCATGLRDAWGARIVRVEEFVFNEAGKFARVRAVGGDACSAQQDTTRFLKLEGTTCVFRPEPTR